MKKSLFFLLLFSSLLYGFKTEVLNYKIYTTDNFEIYYPKEQLKEILPEVENLLEETFTKNTEFFDLKFDYKIPFFLYYGYQQFLQNTIVDVSEGTGGVTEAFKNRFLIPYTGSRKFLQHVINHEFVHEVEFNILYSGTWRTPLLLKSVFYPDWLLEGLAEYRASLFTKTEQEMYVRDMASSDKMIPLEHLNKFSHLKPHMVLPAYEQSAKLMDFIEKEYGKERLVAILKLYRDRFEANSVLNIALGTNLKSLQQKFFEEMKTEYNYEIKINSMTDLDEKKLIVSEKEVYPTYHYSPVVFKDKVIFIGDNDGKMMFYYIDRKQSRKKILIPKRIMDKNVDVLQMNDTRISVSDGGLLCFVGIKDNKSFIYLYDINNRVLKKINIKEIDLVNSAYITSCGEKIFVCGIKDCKSVIFEYRIKDESLSKIMEDKNFISQIALSKDDKKIVYTKELPCVKNNVSTWQTDIFIYSLEESKEYQITSTLSDENFGWFLDENKIIFISDYNKDYEKNFYGVKNLFLVELNDLSKFAQLTNVIGGISYIYSFEDKVFLCYYRNFNQKIYGYSFDELKDKIQVFEIKSENFNKISFLENPKRFSKPYRFNFSTDLFFPMLYYSSYEGLIMLLYWQGSDMVGEHNIALNTVVLGDKNYNYSLTYNFLKFRPAIIFGISGEKVYYYVLKESRSFTELDLGVSYPLNNISYLNFISGYIYKNYKDEQEYSEETKRENIIYLSYIRNTINGKYLEPINGSYHQVSLQISDKIFDGDYSYQILKYDFIKYIHLGKEHSLFTNIKIGCIAGRDKEKLTFDLGGVYGISGLKYGEVKSQQAYLVRIGYRIPIVYDINYYMWYLFPDLFFKGFYSEPFVDFGWDKELNSYNSFGVKFKLNTFVLQSFVLKFELIFAKQLAEDKEIISYFNISGGM